jgi:hypothetical protein
VSAIALEFLQSENHAKLPERLIRAPGQIEKCGMRPVYDIQIMIARHK